MGLPLVIVRGGWSVALMDKEIAFHSAHYSALCSAKHYDDKLVDCSDSWMASQRERQSVR